MNHYSLRFSPVHSCTTIPSPAYLMIPQSQPYTPQPHALRNTTLKFFFRRIYLVYHPTNNSICLDTHFCINNQTQGGHSNRESPKQRTPKFPHPFTLLFIQHPQSYPHTNIHSTRRKSFLFTKFCSYSLLLQLILITQEPANMLMCPCDSTLNRAQNEQNEEQRCFIQFQ